MCQQPIQVSNAPAAFDSYQQPAPVSNGDDLWGDLPVSDMRAPSITNLPAAPVRQPSGGTQSGVANQYIANAQAQQSARREDATSWGNGKIISGIAMIIGSLVWFFGGLLMGVIFFYPPILFVLGVIALLNGIGQKMSR